MRGRERRGKAGREEKGQGRGGEGSRGKGKGSGAEEGKEGEGKTILRTLCRKFLATPLNSAIEHKQF